MAVCRALSPPWESCRARLVRVNTELQIVPVSQAINSFLNFTIQFCELLFLCSEESPVINVCRRECYGILFLCYKTEINIFDKFA